MTIPDFQSCMLPLLCIVSDGNEWTMKDVTERIADQFHLTAEERDEMIPSGNARTIVNRVGWAKTYLKEAGLLLPVRRGVIQITEDGRTVLSENPPKVDMAYLERFPSYVEFRERKGNNSNKSPSPTKVIEETTSTPDDLIIQAYRELRNALAEELLEQVKEMSDKFFERLVVELLVSMGYGGSIDDAGKAVGKSGDGGIDGVIKEDKLGLDAIVIQAKRWTSNSVGRPDIQSFAGSMEAYRANKGVFITTSTFSQPAIDYVSQIQRKIVLVDGETLANLMIDHGIGVSEYRSIALKRMDTDFFQE
ncbi:restriction endonuclease [Gimesia chilikensis]|uniref:restriction endonuclease n=1 Tax=Gimesia chilikensis TaxID=2605989 RepID=UPI003A95BE0B